MADFHPQRVFQLPRQVNVRQHLIPIVVFAAWVVALVGGLYTMSSFGLTRGAPGDPHLAWPEQSLVSRRSGQPTLLLFGHPRCPCTNASLEEFKKILAQSQVPLTARVVFLVPNSAGPDWQSSSVVRAAEEIPSVEVIKDSGIETKRFGVATSGHMLLYSASGRLQFSGGITASRGHVGANSAADAVVQLINRQSTNLSRAPTFGCPLFQKSDLCQESSSCPK